MTWLVIPGSQEKSGFGVGYPVPAFFRSVLLFPGACGATPVPDRTVGEVGLCSDLIRLFPAQVDHHMGNSFGSLMLSSLRSILMGKGSSASLQALRQAVSPTGTSCLS